MSTTVTMISTIVVTTDVILKLLHFYSRASQTNVYTNCLNKKLSKTKHRLCLLFIIFANLSCCRRQSRQRFQPQSSVTRGSRPIMNSNVSSSAEIHFLNNSSMVRINTPDDPTRSFPSKNNSEAETRVLSEAVI